MGSTGAGMPAPQLKPLNHAFQSCETTIFEVMSRLAAEHKSVNLGQGFPDEEGPESMKKVVTAILSEQSNQYGSLMGTPELRQAIARHSEKYQNIPLNWTNEVVVTVGAQEGIAVALMGLCNPGDEVIAFEPLYDSYAGMAAAVGVKLVPVQLQPPSWSIPREELAAAFSAATKLVLLNTPHNPTGKVFTREELLYIAELAQQYNTYVVSDEVYEHLVHPGHKHISIRSLPGMSERVLQLKSAGKTFSFTAWRVGWVAGPAALLAPVIKAHQYVTFTIPTCLQQAVAFGLDHEAQFYENLGASLAAKRALLEPRVSTLGFKVLPAQGTYFLVADVSDFLSPGEDDCEFCKRMTTGAGVTLIPVSPFYMSKVKPHNLVRFCFCKDDAKLLAACERLEQYFSQHKQ